VWEYKVVAGSYAVDGADVVVENPMGKGTLQRILDHYGNEGFELVSSHYDNINREVIMTLKKPKGGLVQVAPQMMAPQAHVAAALLPAGDDDLPPRRRAAGGDSKGRRRSKADLDRLYRES